MSLIIAVFVYQIFTIRPASDAHVYRRAVMAAEVKYTSCILCVAAGDVSTYRYSGEIAYNRLFGLKVRSCPDCESMHVSVLDGEAALETRCSAVTN